MGMMNARRGDAGREGGGQQEREVYGNGYTRGENHLRVYVSVWLRDDEPPCLASPGLSCRHLLLVS